MKSICTPFAIDCLKVGKDGVGGMSDDITSLNPKTEELTQMDWIEPRETPGLRERFTFNEPYTIQIWIGQANGRQLKLRAT
ncbi:hypothetical protein KY289_020212 [Solanum tuberosum]|nr:hypothetical protein KY289_020212 [Solanum tuberosum]